MDFGPDVKQGRDRSGRAYGRPAASPDDDLVRCGPGTLGGELLRRYWQPLARSEEATRLPRLVGILGEELILFRDGSGRPGLLYPRCMHRGTTLLYGRVEENGIRCCYHGWLFDPEGHVLEMACEPGARAPSGARQPWYPLVEKFGLIFAYMGPPEKKPVLPRYQCLENLTEDEYIVVDDTSLGTEGDVIMPCNWLQHFENLVDGYHLATLHHRRSDQIEQLAMFTNSGRGVVAWPKEPLPNGQALFFIAEAMIPTVRALTNPFAPSRGVGWTLPIDDTHLRNYQATRMKRNAPASIIPPEVRAVFNDVATWKKMTHEERRNRPGDWEAQTGQGEITLHSEEQLVSSDRGVVMLRKMLRDQLKRIARGEDPVNVSFDPDAPPVKLTDGDWAVPTPVAAE